MTGAYWALGVLAALGSEAVPSRVWLDRLAFVVPGGTATRWLLLGDLACLLALGWAARGPVIGMPLALGLGFVALNLVSMAVTDFYLGLALFHVAVGGTAAAVLRRARWLGLGLLGLALALGIAT